MATHDYNIANQTGADFRADLNNALLAIVSNNSNATSPSTTYAYQLWVDTANNVLKLRNSANSDWITTGISITASNSFTGDITGNSATATALATARTINGVSFDGTANISFNTDSVSEGSSNLYFTNERVDDQVNSLLTAGSGISLTYDDAAGTLTIANTNSADITSVVAGDGLTGGGTLGDVTLAVSVDDSSIEINTDTLRVKASGITNAMLAGSIANSKLANSSITINSQAISLGGSHTFDSDDIGEGSSNLYFTNARARGSLSIGSEGSASGNGAIAYNSSTGVFTYTPPVISGLSGDTDDLSEGSSNLYYTDARANAAIDARVTNTFINNLSGVVADTSTALATARSIALSGDVTASGVNFDGTGDITLSTTIAANSVALGTDTTGNYVATIADAGNSRITVANSGSETAAVTLDIADDAIGTDQLANNAVALGTQSTGNYVAGISGTTNEIEVSGSGSETASVTIGLPDNVTIAGNLTVNGTTTSVNTQTLEVEDPLIKLAKANSGADSVDIGFYGLYDTSGSQDLYAGLFRDASDSGKFKLFKDLQAEPTTTVNTSGTGYAVGTLVSNLEGDVTGNVTGNVSGTAATVTSAAQPNITSVGTLSTLTVDDITINDSTISDAGDLTIDVGGDIILDADGDNIFYKAGGSSFYSISNVSGDTYLGVEQSNKDLIIRGNDDGTVFTALTFDMSAAGAATFNNKVTATQLSVQEGSSGGSANANADGLVIDNNGKTGITILTPNNSEGLIFFADPDDDNIGRITYNHSTNAMGFVTNNSTALTVDSSGNLGVGTANPNFTLQLDSNRADATFDADDVSTWADFKIQADTASGNARGIYFDFDSDTGNDKGAGIVGISGDATGGVGSLGFITTAGNVSAERMRIDASGNLGIGQTPVAFRNLSNEVGIQYGKRGVLFADSGLTTDIANNTFVDGSSTRVAMEADLASYYQQYQGNHMWFNAASVSAGAAQTFTERMRIDSSGNLLVGTTDNNVTNNSGNNPGINIGVAGIKGYIASARYQGAPLALNRLDNDGDIAVFQKDGTTIGSIGVSSSSLTIATGDTGFRFVDAADAISPFSATTQLQTDNQTDLGRSSFRFKDLRLAGTGYFGTSVAVGTTSPLTKLTVSGDYISQTDGTRTLYMGSDGSGGLFGTITNHYQRFITNNTERMRIDASGNLLVGKTSGTAGNTIETNGRISAVAGSQGQPTFNCEGDTNTGINLPESDRIQLVTGGTERMRIDSSGNVGIGTASPTGKLEIAATGTNAAPHIKLVESGDTREFNIFNDGSGNGRLVLADSDDDTPDTEIVLADNGVIQFKTANTERVSIDSSGKVGIGDLSPDNKLHVNSGTTNVVAKFESTDGTASIQFKDSGGEAEIGCNGNDVVFFPNGTERTRITDDGHLLIATTTAQGVGGYTFQKGTAGIAVHQNMDGTSGGAELYVFRRNSTQIGSINQSSTNAVTYNTSSDARLKDVTGSARGLDVINNLNPVAYNWKADNHADEGLIAQEVEELVPNAVSQSEDGYYQMDYSKLVTHLVKGMQEQQEQIESLKSEIANLKGE